MDDRTVRVALERHCAGMLVGDAVPLQPFPGGDSPINGEIAGKIGKSTPAFGVKTPTGLQFG
jgi:hypothetical protein